MRVGLTIFAVKNRYLLVLKNLGLSILPCTFFLTEYKAPDFIHKTHEKQQCDGAYAIENAHYNAVT